MNSKDIQAIVCELQEFAAGRVRPLPPRYLVLTRREAQGLLALISASQSISPSVALVIDERSALMLVAQEWRVAADQLRGPRRTADLTIPRHALCYVLIEDLGLRVGTVGRFMHRDHSTVAHSHRRAVEMIEEDADFAERLGRVRAGLGIIDFET